MAEVGAGPRTGRVSPETDRRIEKREEADWESLDRAGDQLQTASLLKRVWGFYTRWRS